ncbi:hypothetical protein [Ruegeria faecimaris]|uniref:Uncharacterized protein n=1 Tax=Ruegeria faecimaris TaxID=686389 RepID=A0A521DS90_9RHOB|nr:hypothetical protein [Ruegeria faecimaris]SMO74564.1 hypothetical protein SAMN06265380_107128 [Ruegeria faecimaris]
MIRTTALALLALLSATSAFATVGLYCEAPDGSGAVFDVGLGTVPGLAVVSATIHADGKHWSLTEVDGAIPIIVAQGADVDMRTVIDFADPEYSRIVASVRLITAVEGDESVTVGTLTIPEIGAFPLVCEGP